MQLVKDYGILNKPTFNSRT